MTEQEKLRLEDIGFYTLSDYRALHSSQYTPLQRCELIVTDRCNFSCPYCRGVRPELRGDMSLDTACEVLERWIQDGLKNVRFSGGEPTLWEHLATIVRLASDSGVDRIAVSTNGSAHRDIYQGLIDAGVNDFSVSLDACCAGGMSTMSGAGEELWDTLTDNIQWLASKTYVTVGVVLTDSNIDDVAAIVETAQSLGVADIRLIPAAQYKPWLPLHREGIDASSPILRYRLDNVSMGRSLRGLVSTDSPVCRLVLDDMAVAGKWHYPCIIYLREGGDPIGGISGDMRSERTAWSQSHDSYSDPICQANCLDVCVAYNNKAATRSITQI